MPTEPARLEILSALARKVLWLSSWTIHHANHIRPNVDGLKVGGHQASSASLATIMSALYFSVLRPQDRVAVKPHASPVFHAIQYLFGHQTREKLENFRGFKGAQSYPSRTKDVDDVDFSTGSVGLGVAQTLFASLVQDYVKAHGWAKDRPEGRMIALVGDAEMDEGNIFEALAGGVEARAAQHLVGGRLQPPKPRRRGARGPVGEIRIHVPQFRLGRGDREIRKADARGLRRTGRRSAEANGSTPVRTSSMRRLCFQGGAAFRKHLRDEIGDQGPGHATDRAAQRRRVAGADVQSRRPRHGEHAARRSKSIDHDRPVCFIAYTIKGVGLPFQGHKDNHAGLMTVAQMEKWRSVQNIRPGHEWDKFEGLSQTPAELEAFLSSAPFNREGGGA